MGIDDIVIFGIAIAMFVISGIAGARKKRKHSASGGQRVPHEYSEPWGHMGGYTVPQEKADEPEPVTSDPPDYIGAHIVAGSTIGRGAISSGGIRGAAVSSIAVQHRPFPAYESSSSEPSALMRGFDLEKAVIYSEILKPKFDE